MGAVAKVVLFASSYAPLLALFWLLNSFGDPWSRFAGGAAVISVVLLLGVWLLLTRTSSVDIVDFTEARNRDSDVMSYVVSYVVPFAAAASDIDEGARWALVLFAVLIGVLYVRSAVFYVHPLLLMVGIHAYEVSLNGTPAMLLSRRRHIGQTERISVVEIGTNVYAERKQNP
ncbi:hypothetical protein ITJ66_16825 [Plantibacter sp. VKM Ac-2885]|uniref:hypothetical protein n=1 Tax=Plantibacter sp. VKM Ac-2885 TaxID=2783828 RepID=UPI00188B1227|nr:hypothetical protein [Plantibacter sp. VKM Ac-2885]MBF4514152.1 hypothetical protein [Plantibacter sp. VKM Ac-2885]